MLTEEQRRQRTVSWPASESEMDDFLSCGADKTASSACPDMVPATSMDFGEIRGNVAG